MTAARQTALQAGTQEPALFRTLQDVRETVRDLTWLWPNWIPNGLLTIVFGPPESGKSFLGLELARCVTTGADWPDAQNANQSPRRVLLLDFEGFEGVTAERAEAMGVPLDQVLLPPEHPLPLTDPRGLDQVREILEASEAGMLLVDSWRDACPGIDENDSSATSAAIGPLRLLGHDLNLPVVLSHHSRKAQSGTTGEKWELGPADLRGSGVLAGAARTIIAIDRPGPSETRRLKVVKSNLGARPDPLGFLIGKAGLHWTEAPSAGRVAAERIEAVSFLRDFLSEGPRRWGDIMKAAKEADLKQRTVERALEEVTLKTASGRELKPQEA